MRSRLQIIDTTDNAGPELVTLEALKLELGITGTTQDESLTARITRESKLIAEICGRLFAYSNAIETFTFDFCEIPFGWNVPPERQFLLLSLYPVQQIDSITIDGTALEDGDWELDAETGRLWRPNNGWWGGVVVVNYWGGYRLPDDAPASLVTAVIEAVSDRIDAASGEVGIREIAHGDARVSYYQTGTTTTAGLSSSVLSLIEPFKRPALA